MPAAAPAGMELHPVSYYVHELKPRIPAGMFQPAPSRLGWLPIHLSVIVTGTITIAERWLPWPLVPFVSVLIGMSFAGLMFLGHEVLHAAVVRGRWSWLRPIVGWICYKNATTLFDPRTGGEWPTLAPREVEASVTRAAS